MTAPLQSTTLATVNERTERRDGHRIRASTLWGDGRPGQARSRDSAPASDKEGAESATRLTAIGGDVRVALHILGPVVATG